VASRQTVMTALALALASFLGCGLAFVFWFVLRKFLAIGAVVEERNLNEGEGEACEGCRHC
jgi:protein-S-isoprenylcysteine O-methyltransferase Ste14